MFDKAHTAYKNMGIKLATYIQYTSENVPHPTDPKKEVLDAAWEVLLQLGATRVEGHCLTIYNNTISNPEKRSKAWSLLNDWANENECEWGRCVPAVREAVQEAAKEMAKKNLKGKEATHKLYISIYRIGQKSSKPHIDMYICDALAFWFCC